MFGLLALGYAIYFVQVSMSRGSTLELYRAAAQASLQGESPYSVVVGTEEREVYKYPPWTVPVFWPLVLLPLQAAKAAWAVVSLACLAAIVWWTSRRARLWIALFAVVFWQNVWLGNAVWGQINLALIALLLWAWPDPNRTVSRASAWARAQLILFGLSFKVFFAPAVLARIDLFKRPAVWLAAPLFLGLFSLPVWIARGPSATVQEFIAASASGDAMYGKAVIRNWPNQGIPALILRLIDADASSVPADLITFLIVAAILIPIWIIVSRRIEPAEQWAGWLALMTAIHPLAWSYNFAFAFPLLVLALDRAWSFDRRLSLPLALFAGAVIAPPLAPIFKRWPSLVLASPRGLAVLLLLFALLRALRSGEEHNRMPR